MAGRIYFGIADYIRDWYIARFLLNNFTKVGDYVFGSDEDDGLYASSYDITTDSLFIGGYSSGPFSSRSDGTIYSTGTNEGALTVARFDLINNSLTVLVRFSDNVPGGSCYGI